MRKLKGLVLVLVLVFGLAAPTAANHGEQVEGLWLAIDQFDGSLMTLKVSELSGGFFNVVFTDTRATGGCEPAARFRAVTNTATFDPSNGRFFTLFEQEQIRCFGRSAPSLPFFELQFCSVNDPVHCTDPVDPDPNIMIDLILDKDEDVIGGGNVWFHVHG